MHRIILLTLLNNFIYFIELTHHRKYPVFVIKLLIAGISIVFIYLKVISRDDFGEMVENTKLTINQKENIPVATLIIILMCVNWLFESIKWRLLLNRIVHSSLLLAIRSVLTGVTVSLFTPNRVGEFAGRVMHIGPDLRIRASVACVIGSINQLLVTILAGIIGFYFSLEELQFDSSTTMILLIVVSPLILSGVVILYFNLRKIYQWLQQFSIFSKYSKYFSVLRIYSKKELMLITLLSMVRYVIFSIQFILMLKLFGVQIDILNGLRVISLIYIVMTIIPTIAISELSIRGSVALYFLVPYASNSAGILAATSLLWFVNLVIPALLGALMIFYIKFSLRRIDKS